MADPGSPGSRALVALAAVVFCAAITAAAFWVADQVVGGMPSPWWGAAGGAVLALLSYLRTGRARGS